MKDILVLLATMGGGLGCFLLGMKHLSEGLQSVGGAGLKRFMSAMTTNRIAGMMTGVVSNDHRSVQLDHHRDDRRLCLVRSHGPHAGRQRHHRIEHRHDRDGLVDRLRT